LCRNFDPEAWLAPGHGVFSVQYTNIAERLERFSEKSFMDRISAQRYQHPFVSKI
jgi:hypothetical protein